MFFSDVAGFTNMCDQLFPWEIIGVLNRLYCVMDYLAEKFGLYKVSYVCFWTPHARCYLKFTRQTRWNESSFAYPLVRCKHTTHTTHTQIETIGDAYVCAAGLPLDDPRHAQNVATFALAVSHAARHVLSPVTGEPLKLRVGIHTGSCASGIVGVKNPRYCVFG